MEKFHIAGILFVFLLFTECTQFCLCGGNTSFGCIDGERQALLKFKRSLDNPSNRLSSWEGTDCCKWEGIICDGSTGHVLKLDLRSLNVADKIEGRKINSSLLELKYLNYLDLSGNHFYGSPIPEFLGLMKRLTYLNLSTAHFGGVVPSQLGNLTNLKVLDISEDTPALTIHNLEWLSRLSSLQHLGMSHMGGADLSGARNLFQVLSMLPSLSVLHLSSCRLDNTHMHPAELNSTPFSNIQDLDLSFNLFQGPFPSFLRNMTSLRFLDLSHNKFHSSIPQWLGNLKNLLHLSLWGNRFDSIEGGMSMILWNRCSLKSLDLSFNKFDNELLETRRNLSGCVGYDLEELCLGGNKFSSQFPDWLASLENLKKLGLRDNKFYGPIPASIQSLSNLEELDLRGNWLNGTIPAALGKLSRLRVLNLYKNQLSGVVPDSFGQLLDLEDLNLSLNSLEGYLTEIHLSNLSKLEMLIIGSNHLTVKVKPGWVPSFQLTKILMNSCKMVIQFPRWLETQKKLTWLNLSNCSISGPLPQNIGTIPSSLCKMKNLQILDLSGNVLSGDIPNCWSDFQRLEIIKLSSNKLTGVIPRSLGKLHKFDSFEPW